MEPKERRNAYVPQQLSRDSQTRREFYRRNEHLGSESRTTEFKNGPGFVHRKFRQNVAKYVCGFVNNNENGKLLIGVNDEGCVCGIDCNHLREDILRRDVDAAFTDLKPSIFPKDYSVRFVPVCNEKDDPIGILKVIEIMVQGANMEVKDQLYCNRQGVFMRRDGSIQELRANEIQEWMRRRYQSEIDKLREKEGNLQSKFQSKQNELKQIKQKLDRKKIVLQRLKSSLSHVGDENRHLKDEIKRYQSENDKQRENEGNLQNKLQNNQSELRQTKEKLLQKQHEFDRKEMDLQRQQSAMGHIAEENRLLKDEINHLKQINQQHGTQGDDEVIERLAKMEQILKDQVARINKKKSKVCVIL